MRIDIMTLFPDMCRAVYSESIVGRAVSKGILEINAVNIRDFSTDKHNRVDDTPYGGGMGMLMQAQPIFDCCKHIESTMSTKPHVIYMSPQGAVLNQQRVKELSKLENIVILCGHYEGVDERVLEEIVDEEISVGDYVLTGGEIPAMVLIDSVSRYIEGVISSKSTNEESFSNNLLEYPQYTRPEVFNDVQVPEILKSGHHENINKWRRAESLKNTYKKRPELLKDVELSYEDKKNLGIK